jgi:polyisoprenoid-binding protein YceI
MRHPIRWLLGGVLVVVLAVVGYGIWYVFGDSAPPKPTLSESPAIEKGGPATPDGTWKVARGDEVFVGYRIKEVFAGDTIRKDAAGRSPIVDGTMTIEGNKVTAASVTADLRELKSNRANRDNYIHRNAIETDTFPQAKFTLTSPIALPARPKKGVKVHTTAAGTLLLHGVTRPVTVTLDARWDGTTIEAVGSAPIVLADYKIDAPDTGVVKVDDQGSFELALTFRKG